MTYGFQHPFVAVIVGRQRRECEEEWAGTKPLNAENIAYRRQMLEGLQKSTALNEFGRQVLVRELALAAEKPEFFGLTEAPGDEQG